MAPAETETATATAPRWRPRFDDGPNGRGKIGLVLIPNEQTVEADLLPNLPAGVGLYSSRAVMPREISTRSLATLRSSIADTAARILPDDGLDVVCFACTSGTVAVGEDASLAELHRGAPGAKATTLAGGVRKALSALGARRIVIGTPYVDPLTADVARFFEAAGFEVLDAQGLGLDYDAEMIRVAPSFLEEFAAGLDRPDADAVLISCGALRTTGMVECTERRLGKPLVTSNQAMLWDCLRLAGIEDRLEGLGRLLREH
jgi:maleate isomerase